MSVTTKKDRSLLNLTVLLDDSAREEPERTAIIYEDTGLSYAELNAAARELLITEQVCRQSQCGSPYEMSANHQQITMGSLFRCR